MVSIVPLQKEIHTTVKINDSNMEHVQEQHIVPIIFHEFARVACEYPIAFVKNTDTGAFQAVCILGVKPKQNKFVKNGQWIGGYIPMSVRHTPLHLIPEPNNPERMLIGINETSARISLDIGQALFSENGDETEYLQARKKALIDYFERDQVSQQVTQYLANLGLLTAQDVNLTVNEENLTISGVYIIDEEKLNALSDDAFSELRKKGLLPVIYAQLISLQQLERVAVFNGNL